MPDLLIELFSEEIPARMQARARADLQKLVTDGLVTAGLTYAGAAAFSTPRRLTLAIDGLSSESAATSEERKGPATTAPDAAIEGFSRSTGLSRDQLTIRDDKKGQVWFAVIKRPGRKAPEIIAEVLEATIRTFPWPKSMRWGAGTLRWVRPLHSILCILSDESGAEVVPLSVDGITAGNTTQGHRFLSKGPIAVSSFDDYTTKLKRAHVVLDSAERAAHIWADATNAAFAAGLEVVEDQGLLAEVAGLVEWPVVLMGKIGADFLALPPEVLQTSMREHQKFFSVKNPKSGRIEAFVTVANTMTADHGATILAGNQKVLSARLSDAKFFWENDLREAEAGMGKWIEGLKSVIFHGEIGTQAERIERIKHLSEEIAPFIGTVPSATRRAAHFAKADLRSSMVNEFPELQGTMGSYYAQKAGASPEIAAASRAHYQPLGPSDIIPSEPVSVSVALADKLDTLACFWSINQKPTGSKDPFALRRASLGVIRLVVENNFRMSLLDVLRHSPKLAEVNAFWMDQIAKNKANLEINTRKLDDMYRQSTEYIRKFDETGDISFQNAAGDINSRTAEPELQSYFKGELEQAIRMEREISVDDLLAFLHDRLKVYLKDQGIRHDVIDACLAMPNNDDLTLLVKRAEALSATLKTDDGENLLQGFKRANNILSAEEKKDGVEYSYGADAKFAEDPAESALFTALDDAEAAITPAMQAEDFASAMQAMAALRAPIDAFFGAVQVNADNPILRRNRLNLLSRIRTICLSVADLTKIDG